MVQISTDEVFGSLSQNTADENSKFNSEYVSEELSHPIKGFVPGLSVINSKSHLSNFFKPDCIAVFEGL